MRPFFASCFTTRHPFPLQVLPVMCMCACHIYLRRASVFLSSLLRHFTAVAGLAMGSVNGLVHDKGFWTTPQYCIWNIRCPCTAHGPPCFIAVAGLAHDGSAVQARRFCCWLGRRGGPRGGCKKDGPLAIVKVAGTATSTAQGITTTTEVSSVAQTRERHEKSDAGAPLPFSPIHVDPTVLTS